MLDESSYLTALGVYIGTASLAILCLLWWLRRSWSGGWLTLGALLSAALLLTPAFPKDGVETMAPALVIAVFQYFTQGYEAAEHALRPLAFTCSLAVVVALLVAVFLRLTRSRAT